VINILIGLGTTFQWPDYSAVISTVVPKEQYGRANALLSLVDSGPNIVAPMLAGTLLPFMGLKGVLIIDVLSFVLAIGVLLFVHIPQPPRTLEGEAGRGSILREAAYGFEYIFHRRSLLYLQIMMLAGNIFIGIPNSLTAPMVLSRTGNDSLLFGSILSAGAIAAVVGGLLMSAWAGFKRRIVGLLLGWGAYLFFTGFIFGFGRSLLVWIPAVVLARVGAILGSTSANALWQSKVAPDLIAWVTDPIMPVLAGAMADYWMEPAMQSGDAFARSLEWAVGSGPGSGMSFLMIVFGLIGAAVLMLGFLIPDIRNIDSILPDHDQLELVEEVV